MKFGHLEREQPYLGDLQTIVINHLQVAPENRQAWPRKERIVFQRSFKSDLLVSGKVVNADFWKGKGLGGLEIMLKIHGPRVFIDPRRVKVCRTRNTG